MASTLRILNVNGREHQVNFEDRKLLLDTLREDLGLTGAHAGCEHGVCGACTVLLNGSPVRSCLMFTPQAEGHEVSTVESIANGDELTSLQQAFVDNLGLQCGYCTSAMVLTAHAYLQENPKPTREEVRDAISGNLCRSTGYTKPVEAVMSCATAPALSKKPGGRGRKQ